MFSGDPIGYFHSIQKERYAVPRQANLADNEGIIALKPHCHFEQALEGLEGFERIWIIFWFHRNHHWKPKVLPPRGRKKRGVLATRSPHRPNFIGLSCVELKEIKGLKLFIINHDLVDGTPILDIKPYLNYADSFISTRQGWLDELDPIINFEICWLEEAKQQLDYLYEYGGLDLEPVVTLRLQTNPFPYPGHRIKQVEKDHYNLAYKSWRILYEIVECQVNVLKIFSGYDEETLKGKTPSRWEDVSLHMAFNRLFKSN